MRESAMQLVVETAGFEQVGLQSSPPRYPARLYCPLPRQAVAWPDEQEVVGLLEVGPAGPGGLRSQMGESLVLR